MSYISYSLNAHYRGIHVETEPAVVLGSPRMQSWEHHHAHQILAVKLAGLASPAHPGFCQRKVPAIFCGQPGNLGVGLHAGDCLRCAHRQTLNIIKYMCNHPVVLGGRTAPRSGGKWRGNIWMKEPKWLAAAYPEDRKRSRFSRSARFPTKVPNSNLETLDPRKSVSKPFEHK